MNISDHETIFLSRKKKKERFVTKYIDARYCVYAGLSLVSSATVADLM